MSGDLDARTLPLRERVGAWAGVDPREVRVVVSPYRVCPIGAHVDHQGGPVLGMTIDAYTFLAFSPSSDAGVRLRSANFDGEVVVDLGDPAAAGDDGWGRYARGAACAVRERLPARPRGIVGFVAGDLPGGGLSSSASVLLAYLSAIAAANDVALAPEELVALCRRAENEFVGLASGILDPASIVGARRGEILLIETGESRWESIRPGGPAPRVLVAFSGVARNLTGTGFNERVTECRAGARLLAELAGAPAANGLGELSDGVFEKYGDALPEKERLRARHFFLERARVRRGVECWRQGDFEGFGGLMNESCVSSIESYQVGSPELVSLARSLQRTDGVLGARFQGGGYGGCCVALVEDSAADTATVSAERAFLADFPHLTGAARFFLASSEDGLRFA